MNRRWILLAVGVMVIVGAVSLSIHRNHSPAPVTLRLIGEAVSTVDAIEKVKSDFTKATGIRIEVEKYEFQSALDKTMLDLTSHSGKYDIVLQYAVALGKLSQAGHLYRIEDLSAMISATAYGDLNPKTDFFPNVWKELSWHGGICYGFPFAANTMYVWYRKDLLQDVAERRNFLAHYKYELKPPTTWKQYRDIAEFFTRPTDGLYGTILQGKRHPALWYEWLNFAFSFGGGVMEKKRGEDYGRVIVNSPQTIDATRFYTSLKEFSPPGVTNFTWDDALTAMQQGKIALCIMWSDSVYSLEDPKSSKVVGRVGYCPLPAGRAGAMAQIAGGSYFISRYSKHPREAMEFVLWSLQRARQVQQQLSGGSSPLRATYSDEAVRRLPYTDAFFTSMERARYMTDSVPETEQITDFITAGLSEILAGKIDPQKALGVVALQIHKLLPKQCPLAFATD